MPTRCFMVRWNGRGRRYLRRYSSFRENVCPLKPGQYSYHNADSPIIDVLDDPQDEATGVWTMERRELALFPQTDERWPKACGCGYAFSSEDQWQVNIEHIYVDDAGGEHTLHDNTPGMMWECDWYFDPKRDMAELPERLKRAREGKDMLSARYLEQHATQRAPLVVVLPSGEHWCIDSKANNGPGWSCSGTPPVLVCSPSILSTRYHGWLGCNGAEPGWLTNPL